MDRNFRKNKIKDITIMGLLAAMTIILSLIESYMSITFGLIQGVKLGLANVVIMYAIFLLKKRHVYFLIFLKAMFSLTRGLVAASMSFSGSFVSATIMILILTFFDTASYSLISVFGAISHNFTQYILAIFILGWPKEVMIIYIPVLLISGILMGYITSLTLSAILPILKKLGLHKSIINKEKK